MFAFAAAVFFLIITPGPGVLSVAGVGSAFGARPGYKYMAGLFIGNNVVGLAVITGVAAALLANPFLRTALLYASIAYLCYLAAKIAFAGSKIAFINSDKAPGFIGGLALQAVNPKAYVVNTTFYSGFPFYPESLLTETILKLVIFNAIWIPIHVLWLYAGIYMHSLNLSPRVQFGINIFMALCMIAVVAIAALYSTSNG